LNTGDERISNRLLTIFVGSNIIEGAIPCQELETSNEIINGLVGRLTACREGITSTDRIFLLFVEVSKSFYSLIISYTIGDIVVDIGGYTIH
jgi:hypothetical protein